MKLRSLKGCIGLFFLLGIACSGEIKAITVFNLICEFGYSVESAPVPVYGYKLYKKEPGSTSFVQVVTWDNPYVFTREFSTTLPEGVNVEFQLTAVFTDGTESPPSSPYIFNTGAGSSTPATPFQFQRISERFGDSFDKKVDKICLAKLTKFG